MSVVNKGRKVQAVCEQQGCALPVSGDGCYTFAYLRWHLFCACASPFLLSCLSDPSTHAEKMSERNEADIANLCLLPEKQIKISSTGYF